MAPEEDLTIRVEHPTKLNEQLADPRPPHGENHTQRSPSSTGDATEEGECR